jgi:DNA modification methylase
MYNYPEDFINKIICGDCLEVMKDIPDNSIDLVVTSPPYDNLREYKGYKFDFEGIAKELFRTIKVGGVVVWIVGDETKNFCESLSSFKHSIFFVENCGFNLLDTMIYHKPCIPPPYPSMMRYAQSFEYMFVFSRGKPNTFNPILIPKIHPTSIRGSFRQKDGSLSKQTKKGTSDKKKITNLWSIASGGKDKGHPAPFPEKLAEDHILSWSSPDNIVLDPMCGSGTTCKMSKLNHRNFIGIDISEEYCSIARQRLLEV